MNNQTHSPFIAALDPMPQRVIDGLAHLNMHDLGMQTVQAIMERESEAVEVFELEFARRAALN